MDVVVVDLAIRRARLLPCRRRSWQPIHDAAGLERGRWGIDVKMPRNCCGLMVAEKTLHEG
jgi:hypothetical protein